MSATELGGRAIRAALERAGIVGEQIQHVVMGQVIQAGAGQVPSRQAQIAAGIPREVPSETVNKVCASGMRAIALVDTAIRAGDLQLAVAGGMESMSGAPYLLPGARFGYRMGDAGAVDALVYDGLRNPFTGKAMYVEATEVAAELQLERPALDRWALRSHQRAIAAVDSGCLATEIVPVTVPAAGLRHGGSRGAGAVDRVVELDEGPRRDASLQALAALPGLVAPDSSHTAGNSPSVNDGAAAVVLADESWARRNGHAVLARIVAHAQVADDFAYLARTPAAASLAVLARRGLTPADVDLWEINEAFASVAVNTVRTLQIDEDRVNVNGGAVALGHPIGASGARIVASLALELRRRGGGLGCAAICSGAAQGDAMLIEVAGE